MSILTICLQQHIYILCILVNLYAVGDDLYYKGRGGLRLVLKTRHEIEQALKECHDDPGSGGHRGMTITRLKVEETYYWKSMTVDVRDWVSCQYVWVRPICVGKLPICVGKLPICVGKLPICVQLQKTIFTYHIGATNMCV